MEQSEILLPIASELEIQLSGNDDYATNRLKLTYRINELLEKDFSKMLFILYRMDINESRLKLLLKENPGKDAGFIIADLMIEREMEKARSRNEYRRKDLEIDENEKW